MQPFNICLCCASVLIQVASSCHIAAADSLRLKLTITSSLAFPNTPLDPTIDFADVIRQANATGVLNPNSIEIRDAASGQQIPHALAEDFAYSDKGRVQFIVANPRQTEFEIQFRTVPRRPALQPPAFIPQIGTGDLLRYNALEPRPISLPYSPGLHDLNGDGWPDLTGTWNYAHRPGRPWDGIVCHLRTNNDTFLFRDLRRLRFETDSADAPSFFSHTYMAVDFADFDSDGKLDLVTTRRGTGSAEIYLNTGEREPSGLPRFRAAGKLAVKGWQACRATDLNNDGALDLIVDGEYLQNDNPVGWPFQAAPAVTLDAGRKPCFLDIDNDGHKDAICLHGAKTVQPDFYQVAWRRNIGGDPPAFADKQILQDIDVRDISLVSAWSHGERSGLIVQHAAFQQLSFFEVTNGESPLLRYIGRAESLSAVMSLSDQAWPWLCDWDNDGDIDLLVGGGYGWPRIVINDTTGEHPKFREPQRLMSAGQPIRFVRNEILGKPNSWHDMGYPMPVYVDWDGDGLKDLLCPNETNRIFWYRNVGSDKRPEFGIRRQVQCEGSPDSPELRQISAERAIAPTSNNGVYPSEKERPFFWRTGAAVADFNGDGLMDLVTHDGETRVATLFVQFRREDGSLGLRKQRPLRLADGRQINDAIVSRRSHWTESFRPVDWNTDGLTDLVYSVAGALNGTKDGGSIYLLLNVGSKTEPVFAEPETMRCFGTPIRITNHGPHPWPGDFDGDGRPDLVACVEWSVYPFYSHAALMMNERPTYTLEQIP